MKEWILSETGDKWSVKLDVRDMGGHLDTTHRRRATTLIGRVLGLLGALLVVMALPLTFTGKLRVLRSNFLPGALHWYFFYLVSETQNCLCRCGLV